MPEQVAVTAPRDFNPLPPHGGRQIAGTSMPMLRNFNPLPPHGGRHMYWITFSQLTHFNPLPPHGGRLWKCTSSRLQYPFQSTPSAWRETEMTSCCSKTSIISIHSLRMEGDRLMRHCLAAGIRFQSTPSAWRETHCSSNTTTRDCISIHSLRMEGDESFLLSPYS